MTGLSLGMGYADMRKGFDLFLSLWRSLQAGPASDATGPACIFAGSAAWTRS